jgi:hypothetical protein
MHDDVVIRITQRTHRGTLARQMLEARRDGRGTVWVSSRSGRKVIAAATALIAAEAPEAIQFRATPVDGPEQVIRWLAPGEQPGPEAATFHYPTGRRENPVKVGRTRI